MMMISCNAGDAPERDASEKMAEFFGPGQVDQIVRSAIQMCWMALPADRRTPDELEAQIRRLVDRAMRDFREDREQFGKGSS
jgi:hypothetical protein